MGSIVRANLECIEYLLHAPNTLSQPKKRWHSAFLTIYCSKTLLSFFNVSPPEKKSFEVSRLPSFTIVDLKSDTRFKIDQNTLIQLVKEKNVDSLQKIGGVVGVASSLEANVEFGIQGDAEDIAHRHEAFGSNTYKNRLQRASSIS
jgi:Ca2+-transporting ATPase